MGPSRNTGDTYGMLKGKSMSTDPSAMRGGTPTGEKMVGNGMDTCDVMGHVGGSCPQSGLPPAEAARHASMMRAASSAKRDGPVGKLPRAGYALV